MSIQENEGILVNDVMMDLNRVPIIQENAILKKALEEMGLINLGIVCIVDSKFKLLGILTDGDIRRKLLSVQKPFSAFFVDDALDHSIRNPLTIGPSETLLHAVNVMGGKKIWDLPVVDSDGVLMGLLHLHPVVKKLLNVNFDNR
jgi:CBS domain-containing protein